MKIRNLTLAAVTAAVFAVGAGTAAAAPHRHTPHGFLGTTITPAAEVFLPPGQAVKLAQTACANTAAHPALTVAPVGTVLVQPADLTVDAVRGAFPTPVAVCTGVTLVSQVGAVEAM